MNKDTDVAIAQNDIDHIKATLNRIEKNSVTKARFKPVEMIAYGLAAGTLFWALNQVLETAQAIF